MNIARFNFNLINHKDLRKYLTKILENNKWEFSSAFEATLAHYTYNRKMAYGFSHGKSMKITIKKILYDLDCEFVLPFIHFTRKTIDKVLEDNSFFFDDGYFYFRVLDGKKDYSNYLIKNVENVQQIVRNKYNKSSNNFIVEKSLKKLVMYEEEIIDLRVYVLVTRIKSKYYTFLYPTIFANFKNNVSREGLLYSLGLGEDEFIGGQNSMMKDIYNLVQKTSVVLSNYLDVSSKIFKLEKDMKKRLPDTIDFQYNLYGLDIVLNSDLKPILSDIAINPSFGLLDLPQNVIREKLRMYDDMIQNFVIHFGSVEKIDVDKTKFVILNNAPPDVLYYWIVSKKISNDEDETIEYKIDSNETITPQGELLVQNMMSENKFNLTNDNLNLNSKIGIKPRNNVDALLYTEKLLENYNSSLGNEHMINNGIIQEVNEDDPRENIERKINELFESEKESGNIMKIAKKTIPLIGLAFAAKKTYTTYKKYRSKQL